MKRRAIVILSLLLIAIAINVGVAWVLAMTAEFPAPLGESPELPHRAWPIGVPPHWPEPQRVLEQYAPALHYKRWHARVAGPDGRLRFSYLTDRVTVGWPFPSLCAFVVNEAEFHEAGFTRLSEGHPDSFWTTGLPRPFTLGSGQNRVIHTLPIQPRWPAFLANTLLYAVPLGIVWLLLPRSRRSRRLASGQCGACGYPIGASAVCTECGRAVGEASG